MQHDASEASAKVRPRATHQVTVIRRTDGSREESPEVTLSDEMAHNLMRMIARRHPELQEKIKEDE